MTIIYDASQNSLSEQLHFSKHQKSLYVLYRKSFGNACMQDRLIAISYSRKDLTEKHARIMALFKDAAIKPKYRIAVFSRISDTDLITGTGA